MCINAGHTGSTIARGAISPWACLRRRWIRRGSLRADERGAAAVEFAMVVIPFCGLMFGIMAQCLNFFYQQVLDTAVTDAARMIATGQVQASALTADQFKQKICDRLTSMSGCMSKLTLDVRTFDSYSNASLGMPITNGQVSWTPVYQPGSGGQLVVVRVIYPVPVYTNFLASNTSNLANGNRVLMSAQVFRNEPF